MKMMNVKMKTWRASQRSQIKARTSPSHTAKLSGLVLGFIDADCLQRKSFILYKRAALSTVGPLQTKRF